MKEFNSETYDVSKNLVIEASAGTGKTFNVVRIVEKLIKTIDFSKILIVTYTDKACGELRDRIGKIDNIDINKANIYTIHSFCLSAIKEFGVSANLCLSLRMEEKDDIENFAKRYLRCGNISSDITKIISNGIDFKENTIRSNLVDGCKKYYLNKNNEVDKDIIQLDNSNIVSKFEDLEISYTKDEILDLLILLKTGKDFSEFFKCFSSLEDNLEKAKNIFTKDKSTSLYDSLEHYKDLNNLFKYDGIKFRKSNNGDERSKLIDYFKELHGLKEIKIEEFLFFEYIDDFYKKYLDYKIENGIESFDDMIRYVREEILNNPLFKEALRQRYTYAIIDEFQDTNQKQFDIFKNIFMTEGHNIIVVGDPKQSIYGFQGADVSVYLKAKNEIEKSGELNYLCTNYRSNPMVVEGCNKIFEGVKFSGEEFKPSKTTDGKESTLDKALYYAVSAEGKTINQYEFAKICVEQIIKLCKKDCKYTIKDGDESRNFNYSDFTVLVRNRKEAIAIKNALRKAGIPFIMYSDRSLFNERECAQFIAILEALIVKDFTGSNRKYYYKAMLTKFFGYKLNEIKYEYFDKDDTYEMELIASWRKMANEEKYEDLFESIIYDSRLQKNLSDSKYIETLAKFKQIANYALDYLIENKSLFDLLETLKGLNKDIDEDESGATVERGTEKHVVTIMTMHASKGLQFNAVICFGGFKGPNNFAKICIDHTKRKIVYNKDVQIKAEEDEEIKRLIYVAYTRAVYLLILPNYEFKSFPCLSILNKNIANSKPYLKEIQIEGIPYDTLKKESEQILDMKKEDITINPNIKPLVQTLPSKAIYKHSYTSLSHSVQKEEDLDNKEGEAVEGLSMFDKNPFVISQDYTKDIIEYNNFPKGAKIGTALHEIFEQIDFKDYENMLDKVIEKMFKKNGIEDNVNNVKMAHDIVCNTINAKMKLKDGSYLRLLNIDNVDRLSEVSFDFLAKENNYLNGAVDLIIRYKDKYMIIDWKSDSISDSLESYNNLSDLKNAVDDRYSIQRTIYSYGLIKWLKTLYTNMNEEEIFNNHFLGIYYIFIKGTYKDTPNGIYSQTWDSYSSLEEAYNEIKNNKIGGYVDGD